MGSDRFTKIMLWMLAIAVVGGTVYALRYVRGYRPLMGLGFFDAGGLPADMALRFDDVRIAYRQNNKVAWTLKAGRVETDKGRLRLNFTNGIAAVLMDDGKPRATLDSSVANYDTTQHVLDVTGKSVCHVFPKGATKSNPAEDITIEAQEIVWNTMTHTVLCRGAFHAFVEGDDIRGNDLSVDLQTRNMSIHQFEATVSVDDSRDNPEPTVLKGLLP